MTPRMPGIAVAPKVAPPLAMMATVVTMLARPG
jgi:hypothetical protein